MKAGRFRADLFFRLSAITLRLPPLRDRTHDIRLLAEHFVRSAAARYGRPAPRLGEDCLSALTAYSFPGNVRELESEMSRLAALASADVPCGADLLNERIRDRGNGQSAVSSQATPVAPMSLHEMEKQLIVSVLQHTGVTVDAPPRFSGLLAKAYGPSSSGFKLLGFPIPLRKLTRFQNLVIRISHFFNPRRSSNAGNLGSLRSESAIGSVGR